ncbi:MAG: hypothetical protein GX289_01620 [Tissierellia bacterium]|jgi:hypothetical protein|nr:hypothetical protein [Tissierellia bacterium]
MMSCCRRRDRDRDEVMGIQRIALRGPGCIDGTGRCRGVLGTGGRRRCEDLLDAAEDFCDEVFGDRGRRCFSNVLGTGGERFCCSNRDLLGIRDREFRCSNRDLLGIRDREFRCSNRRVMGAGEDERCGQVFGTGGGFQCNDVAGRGGRRHRCTPSFWDLKTPFTVPR